MKKIAHGFTLIELMIVIAIIGILASIAIPAYQDYVIRSQISEGISLADGVKAAVWDFESNTGRWPSTNDSAGLVASHSITGNYVMSVSASLGIVKVTLGNKVNSAVSGGVLELSPTTRIGSIPWICKSTTIARKYLPTNCR